MNKKLFALLSGILLSATLVAPTFNYECFALEEETSEAFKLENILNPENYNKTQETIITQEADKININGAATYKLPFDFEQGTDKKVKFKFNINSIASDGEVFVIFHSNPDDVITDYTSEVPGLYLRFKNNNDSQYFFNGYYTDGINYKAEWIGSQDTYSGSVCRDHTIQLETSMIQGYTDGVRVFYHSKHYGDWLGYSMVKNRILTSDNNIYVTISGDVSITNIVGEDNAAPNIKYNRRSDADGYAGEEYVFDEIEVNDEIDGVLPYTTSLINSESKNISDKLYTNTQGDLCFKPLQSGEYTLRISAQDYSYNSKTTKVTINILNRPHYPIFSGDADFKLSGIVNEKYYFPEVLALDITFDDQDTDNNMTYEYSAYIMPNGTSKEEVPIKHDSKGYYFEPSDMEAYIDDGVGQYFLTISATNMYGTSYIEKDIWIKYALSSPEAYDQENLFKKSNWALNTLNVFEKDGLKLAGQTYYKAGLKLEDGIKINISVLDLPDKSEVDNWFSISLLKHPGQAKYSDKVCGLQFMFFYQNGGFRFNLIYVDENGNQRDIKNNEVIYSTRPDNMTLEIAPFDTSLDANMDDNITANFDGIEIDSYELYRIYRSDWVDNDGYVYLACGVNNANNNHATTYEESNNPKYRINSITKTDKTKPEISLDKEVQASGKVGKEITLPTAKGLDDVDGNIDAHLFSVKDSNGKTITVINNKFTPKLSGTYLVTYVATDKSGNSALLEKSIEIEKSLAANKGALAGVIVGSVVLASGITAAIILILKKNKKKKNS